MLNQSSSLLEAYSGPHHTLIKTFYLTIQVTHLLMAGQARPNSADVEGGKE